MKNNTEEIQHLYYLRLNKGFLLLFSFLRVKVCFALTVYLTKVYKEFLIIIFTFQGYVLKNTVYHNIIIRLFSITEYIVITYKEFLKLYILGAKSNIIIRKVIFNSIYCSKLYRKNTVIPLKYSKKTPSYYIIYIYIISIIRYVYKKYSIIRNSNNRKIGLY